MRYTRTTPPKCLWLQIIFCHFRSFYKVCFNYSH